MAENSETWADLFQFLERGPHKPGIYAVQPYYGWTFVICQNQQQVDEFLPKALKTYAFTKFAVVLWPLLDPVDLDLNGRNYGREFDTWAERVDWVIVGGESGPNARPIHLAWAQSIRDQCQTAGVQFFFKQWGEWAYDGDLPDGGERFVKVGKHAAGRLLDGREWNEYPAVAP